MYLKGCLTCRPPRGSASPLRVQEPHAILPFGDEEGRGLLYYHG